MSGRINKGNTKFVPRRKAPSTNRAPSLTPSIASTTPRTNANVALAPATTTLDPVADAEPDQIDGARASVNAAHHDSALSPYGHAGHGTDAGTPVAPSSSPAKRQTGTTIVPGSSFAPSDPSSRRTNSQSQSQSQAVLTSSHPTSSLGLSLMASGQSSAFATQDTAITQPSSLAPPARSPVSRGGKPAGTKITPGTSFAVSAEPPRASPKKTAPTPLPLTATPGSGPYRTSNEDTTTQSKHTVSSKQSKSAEHLAKAGPGPTSMATAKRNARAAAVTAASGSNKRQKRIADASEDENDAAETVEPAASSRTDKGKGKASTETKSKAPTRAAARTRGSRAQVQPDESHVGPAVDLDTLAHAAQVAEGALNKAEAEALLKQKTDEHYKRMAQEAEKADPRRRGRPRKPRPPVQVKQAPTQVVEQATKRGRPKKATAAEVADDASEDDDERQAGLPSDTEAGSATEASAPPAKRARKAKAAAAHRVTEDAGAVNEDAEDSEEDEYDRSQIKVRRSLKIGARRPKGKVDKMLFAPDSDFEGSDADESVRHRSLKGKGKAAQNNLPIEEEDGEDDNDDQSESDAGLDDDGIPRDSNRRGKIFRDKKYVMRTVDPTVTTMADIATPFDSVSGRKSTKTQQLAQIALERKRRELEAKKDQKKRRRELVEKMKRKANKRARGLPSESEEEEQPGQPEAGTPAPASAETADAVVAAGTSPVGPAEAGGVDEDEDEDDEDHVSEDEARRRRLFRQVDSSDEPEYNSDDDPIKASEKAARNVARDEPDGDDNDGEGGGDNADHVGTASVAGDADVFNETAAVQFRNVDGQMVLDQSSLTVARPGITTDDSGPRQVIEEGNAARFVTSATWSRRQRGDKWTEEETAKFLDGVRQFGTDFEMIAGLFPLRTRRMIKSKWNKEDKLNPQRLTNALLGRKAIDLEEYSRITGQDLSGPIPDDPFEEINRRRLAEEAEEAAGGGGAASRVKKRETATPGVRKRSESAGAALRDRDANAAVDGDEEEAAGSGDEEAESEDELTKFERLEAEQRELDAQIAAAEAEAA